MTGTSISLLERLREQGDPHLWQRLVDLYTPLLRAWLGRHGLPDADRDDLTQEVLLVVVRELPQFRHDGRPGSFRAWLRAVLVHRLRNFWKARQRRPVAPGDSDFLRRLQELADPESGLSRLWEQEHDRHVVEHLLRGIEPLFTPKTWQAFRRVVLEEADAAAVAAELVMSVNAVLIAKSRLLTRLRQEGRGLIG